MNMDEEIKEIACKLRQYRELHNITREQFCEKANQNVEYWGTIERGERNISLGKLLEVCRAFRLDPSEVLPKREDGEDTSAELRIVEERIRGYSKKQLTVLLKFMEEILPHV